MTDIEMLNQIQSVLMEPRDDGATFPSGLWTHAEILAYMNERQNRFLKHTLVWVGVAMISPAVIGQHEYNLPQDWLTTADLIWSPTGGTPRSLSRSDSFEADHGLLTWRSTNGTPQLYFDEDSQMLTVVVAPAPDVAGEFMLLYVPQGSTLTGDPLTPEPFVLPDEYVHAVGKYGTLADAFRKDGRGQNPTKAAYCQLRYDMAVEMANILLKGWV